MAWVDKPKKPKKAGDSGCTAFWDSFDSHPIWNATDDECICTDVRTGEELDRLPRPHKEKDMFEQFAVRTLKDIQLDEAGNDIVVAGTEIYAEVIPGGRVYLFEYEGSRTCIHVEAELGIDYEVI